MFDANPSTALERGRATLRLDGCRPTPLASYLKALGVLRLVSEQADGEARGWWERDVFHLESSLGTEELRRFFLTTYEPTPILGPWNGGSGFYPKDAMGRKALARITQGRAQRLAVLRDAIQAVQRVVEQKGFEERPSTKEGKAELVTGLRNTADEPFLRWIDAAVALGTDELLYPPLLGTGGNDGRLDFTVNFMTNLADLIDPEDGMPADGSDELLGASLFGHAVAGLHSTAIGQFAPGSAGGPNAETGFSGDSRINPWDFVLMIEGSILFATGTVRRLEATGRGILAYPFTVRPSGSGAGGTAPDDASTARAETWVPLWGGAARRQEVERLLAEGRIVLGDRRPRDGLDVARAVAKLGTDRGIESLQRYVFLQRSGNAYLAAAMGRIRVQRRPEADLIDDLDRMDWLDRFRRVAGDRRAPARLRTLLHRLEDGLFDLARGTESGVATRRILVTLGECQRYLAASPGAREKCGPVPLLRSDWATAADDGSSAFALAVGLAGLHGVRDEQDTGGRRNIVLTMAEYMAPVTGYAPGRRVAWLEHDHSRRRVVWGFGSIHDSLGRVMRRRLLDQRAESLAELPLRSSGPVSLSASVDWLDRPDWDGAIAGLVAGLSLVSRPNVRRAGVAPSRVPAPAAYALLKACLTPSSQLARVLARLPRAPEGLTEPDIRPPPPDELVRLMGSGRVQEAVVKAHRMLRVRGLPVPASVPSAGRIDGRRLLSTLMVPLWDHDLGALLRTHFRSGSDRSALTPADQEG
ncbi:MAG: type I-U CRISPR-associated protein Csx17 [Gemmatimonadota bacterium]|nr:type I-U CRISPR-associated protein Csx17 [Gemmatimonadota bacterium]